jgi:hypothetical protein
VIESSDPLQLLTRLKITVNEVSLQLADKAGILATMSASMLGFGLHTFQAMTAMWSSVDSTRLTTPSSDIVRTGGLSDEESHFLHVDYTSHPHDTDIDHAVKVSMGPAYVTYDLSELERFIAFFRMAGDEDVDLTALGAQAALRFQEMQVSALSLVPPWSTGSETKLWAKINFQQD